MKKYYRDAQKTQEITKDVAIALFNEGRDVFIEDVDTSDPYARLSDGIAEVDTTEMQLPEVNVQSDPQSDFMGFRDGFDSGDIVEAGFPLTTYGAKQGWGMPATIGAGMLDAASWVLPPALAIRGLRALGTGARAASRFLVPAAIEGASGAGITAGQLALMDEDPALGATIAGVAPAVGGGVATGLSKLAQPARSSAKKIVESVVKPSKKVMQKGYDTEALFERGLVGGLQGPKEMSRRVDAYRAGLNAQYGDELAELAGETVDLDKVYEKTLREVDQMFDDPAGAMLATNARSAAQEFGDAAFMVGGKDTPVDKAIAFRRAVGAESGFDKDPSAVVRGKALFAQKFYRNLNEELDRFPKIRALDKELSITNPLERALDDAVARTDKNQMLSFGDMAAMGMGGAAGAASGSGGIGAGAMLAARRATLSPAVANLLWRAGGVLPQAAQYTTPAMFGTGAFGRGLATLGVLEE